MTTTVRRALLLALLAVLVLPTAARADDPLRLAGQLTDRAEVLGTGRGEAETALRRLQTDTGLQLFVVFVRSFDGVPAEQWTDRTVALSDLGDRDALLAVAVDDRTFEYSFPEGVDLTRAELADIAQRRIEPALARDDWAGAVVAAADGYRAELAGPGLGGSGTGGFGAGALACLLLPVGAVVATLLWARSRRRRAATATAAAPGVGAPPAGPPDPLAGVRTDELDARANALLVELDDDLRASERELGLATAQYGPEATAGFQAALDAARQEVAEAFRLRLTLDEEPPPDEPHRRAVLAEIVRRCEAADARLDAESEAFDTLRDLEGRVEQVAAELDRRRSAAEARLPAAAAALRDVQARYAGATVAAVAGNVDQARERLTFTTSALSRAREAVGQGDRAEGALAVRSAEQAVDQAEQLIDGIDRTRTDLDAARAGVDTLLVEVESDLAAARAAQGGGGSAGLAAAIAGAEQALAAVRSGLAGSTSDPLAAVRQLEQADAALDRALADARDTAERTGRARALLDQALVAARAEIAAAGDFITTRRGAVGGQARAWLAEAQRHLALAESRAVADPAAALADAEEAHRLAAYAGQAARDDVAQWSVPGGYGAGYGGGYGDPMGGFAGAVLGGILAGGMRGGGWGGGGSFGGGGWGGGGFGGSGTRSRRTGGGGGGRMGGGGRF